MQSNSSIAQYYFLIGHTVYCLKFDRFYYLFVDLSKRIRSKITNFYQKVKVPNNQKCYARLVILNCSMMSDKNEYQQLYRSYLLVQTHICDSNCLEFCYMKPCNDLNHLPQAVQSIFIPTLPYSVHLCYSVDSGSGQGLEVCWSDLALGFLGFPTSYQLISAFQLAIS